MSAIACGSIENTNESDPCFKAIQQKGTVDPKTVQQIRVLAAKYDEAINRHDAAAVASLYTQDGVGQIPESKVSPGHGGQGIEKAYGRWFKGWQAGNDFTTVDRVTVVGNQIRSFGKWSDVFKGTEGGYTSFEGYSVSGVFRKRKLIARTAFKTSHTSTLWNESPLYFSWKGHL